MISLHIRMRPLLLLSLVVALCLALAGCGMDAAPTEPDGAAVSQAPAGQTVVSFWSTGAPAAKTHGDDADDDADDDGSGRDAKKAKREAERAAKKAARKAEKALGGEDVNEPGTYVAAPDQLSISGSVGPDGGVLAVGQDIGETPADDLQATLYIPARALAEAVDISMEVIGDQLGNLLILFGPAGQTFERDAILILRVGGDLVDMVPQVARHTAGDGSWEDLKIKVKEAEDGGCTITLRLSGFSVYGLRD